MRPNIRSVSGALLMLVIVPIFAGLLACMPEHIPLGDPERSRIKPEMSGIWYTGNADELLGQVVVLQPWDKRTWLVVTILLEPPAGDEEDYDISTYDGVVRWLDNGGAKDDETPLAAVVYKGWLSKIGGVTFLTWESRGLLNEERDNDTGLLDPWFWWDFRVTEFTGGTMTLHPVDEDFPPLKEAPKTQRGWERVIRKHAKSDALYLEEPARYRRVSPEHEKLFEDLVSETFIGEL